MLRRMFMRCLHKYSADELNTAAADSGEDARNREDISIAAIGCAFKVHCGVTKLMANGQGAVTSKRPAMGLAAVNF
jgi:hypothetical protein